MIRLFYSITPMCVVNTLLQVEIFLIWEVMARKYHIQDHYSDLIGVLKVDPILPYLKDEKWLTTDEYETLSSPLINRRQKAEKILLLQPRKTIGGYNGEEILVKSIIWSGQEHLALKLGCTEEDIRQMQSQRPYCIEPDHTQSE